MRCSSDSTARRGIGLGFGGRRPTDPGKSANQGRTRHLEGATDGCLACSAIKRGSNPFKGLSVDHGRPSTLAPSTLCSRQSRHHPLARQRALILRQRSEEHTSELPSLMRISYAVFCLKTKNLKQHILTH